MNECLVETRALTRRFGPVLAVHNLNLQVRPRTIYGFLGPNGAGKTTTIRLLLGLIHPTEGEVRLFGELTASRRPLLFSRVGALVETPSLYPHLSGRENAEITRRLRRLPPDEIERVLSLVRLERDAPRLVHAYSLGMKGRLALALALMGNPRLLILDEPTNGLDPEGIQEMRALLKTLCHEHDITVLLSSHLLSEVEQVATDIGIIHGGTLLFQGTLSQLQTMAQPMLCLQVEQPELALRLMQSWNLRVQADKHELRLLDWEPTRTPELTRRLDEQGIGILSLRQAGSSLEEIYMALVQGHAAERSA